jgi:hypothetical protein
MIYESKSNDADSDESTSWIIVIATIVALAGGIAAFWKFGRSTTPEATKNDKIDGRAGFRWLREEGNDLIPISELAARKQFVTSSISGSPACCLIDLSMVGLGRFLKIRRWDRLMLPARKRQRERQWSLRRHWHLLNLPSALPSRRGLLLDRWPSYGSRNQVNHWRQSEEEGTETVQDKRGAPQQIFSPFWWNCLTLGGVHLQL